MTARPRSSAGSGLFFAFASHPAFTPAGLSAAKTKGYSFLHRFLFIVIIIQTGSIVNRFLLILRAVFKLGRCIGRQTVVFIAQGKDNKGNNHAEENGKHDENNRHIGRGRLVNAVQ